MANQTVRYVSVLPLVLGVVVVTALMGCETAKPGETPRLIMEQKDDTAVPPRQPAESEPSGLSAPH
jgi:hypothetical protein